MKYGGRKWLKEKIEWERGDIEWNKKFIKDMKAHKKKAIAKGWVKSLPIIDEIIKGAEEDILTAKQNIKKLIKQAR